MPLTAHRLVAGLSPTPFIIKLPIDNVTMPGHLMDPAPLPGSVTPTPHPLQTLKMYAPFPLSEIWLEHHAYRTGHRYIMWCLSSNHVILPGCLRMFTSLLTRIHCHKGVITFSHGASHVTHSGPARLWDDPQRFVRWLTVHVGFHWERIPSVRTCFNSLPSLSH